MNAGFSLAAARSAPPRPPVSPLLLDHGAAASMRSSRIEASSRTGFDFLRLSQIKARRASAERPVRAIAKIFRFMTAVFAHSPDETAPPRSRDERKSCGRAVSRSAYRQV